MPIARLTMFWRLFTRKATVVSVERDVLTPMDEALSSSLNIPGKLSRIGKAKAIVVLVVWSY